MPLNLLKKYPELLELAHMTEPQRTTSLKNIFKRDIEDSELYLNNKRIRPIKGEMPNVPILFKHLTSENIPELDESTGKMFDKRIFEMDRSRRLHWIKLHINDAIEVGTVQIFSVVERDKRKRMDVKRTYLYNTTEKYVVVLEPHRSGTDYYLLTAYYLNKPEGQKGMDKRLKKKLEAVY